MLVIQKYKVDPDLYYDPKEHLWVKVDGMRARIGMDPLIQESMGAFVVVQIDQKGKSLSREESFGTVEAEKYVGPLRSPVSGVLVDINQRVVENPRLVNDDPYGDGWFVEVQLNNFEEEKKGLLTGEESVKTWFQLEISKYGEEGWLAES